MNACKLILLIALSALIISCKAQKEYASFQRMGGNPDARIRALDTKLEYVQSKLGIEDYLFEFTIPRGKKMVVRFNAEMKGKPFPKFSATYHVPAQDNTPVSSGSLMVHFFFPKYQALQPKDQDPEWDIYFRISGSQKSFGHTWHYTYPFKPEEVQKISLKVTTNTPRTSFHINQEYEVWTYTVHFREGEKPASEYEFIYTIRVKLTDLGKTEDRTRITKEGDSDFPGKPYPGDDNSK